MKVEFDLDKDAENVRQRGLPLAFGAVVLSNAIGVVEDTRNQYGETRMKAFAQVHGLWFARTYTMRGDVTRILSVHRVREQEARRWLKQE